MKFCSLVLFVTLFLCVAVSLAKDDVTLLAFEVLTVLKCAATSGDQALCDRFEQCTAILTQPVHHPGVVLGSTFQLGFFLLLCRKFLLYGKGWIHKALLTLNRWP
ncbi:uncharacterized protein TNCV_4762671 [Trichonephila clavipes]|nr:uncharacterized protein TNCV_4762671 [Trichonephila clavipes]